MEARGSSRRSNSHGSVLLSQSVTPECARVASYERLSESVRLIGECDVSDGRKKKNSNVGLALLTKVLTFTKISSDHERPQVAVSTAEKKEKKRSSWLPDPERRWPIQGW